MRILRGKAGIMNSVGGTAVAAGVSAPTITTTSPLTAVTYSEAISTITLAYTGGGTPTWSVIAGALISGLSLNASTGEITGTPTEVVTSKSVTIQVSTEGGTDSVVFAHTSALPSVMSGLIDGYRAADYNGTTGALASFKDGATYAFAQGTEAARPAAETDGQGALINFGGDDYLDGNAGVIGALSGLDDASLVIVCEGMADALEYVWGTTSSAQTGFNVNSMTTGAGTTRLFIYHTATFASATATGILMATTRGAAITWKRNTANQPVGYIGSTAYNGTTTKDAALGATAYVQMGANGGATPTFYFNGNVRCAFRFNKSLSAAEVQALMEYIENKSFYGTSGVTLWA